MATQVGNTQNIDATATPTKPDGTAGQVQPGSVVWASSNPAVADIAADPANELHANITPAPGQTGIVDITITGDADLGAGVENIQGTGQLEVIDGQATGFTLAFGNPTPKP